MLSSWTWVPFILKLFFTLMVKYGCCTSRHFMYVPYRRKGKDKRQKQKAKTYPTVHFKKFTNDLCLHFIGWKRVICLSHAMRDSVTEILKKQGCKWFLHIWCTAFRYSDFSSHKLQKHLLVAIIFFFCNLTYVIKTKKKCFSSLTRFATTVNIVLSCCD